MIVEGCATNVIAKLEGATSITSDITINMCYDYEATTVYIQATTKGG